jgi:pilus assembly protein CpaB
MSIRTIAVVILALLSGVGVAMGVLESTRSRSPDPLVAPETEPVLVAVAKIDRGAMLREEDVELQRWPKDLAPAGVLRSVDQVIDRAAMGTLTPGEIILDAKLSAKNSGRGLASLIPEGMRAFTVQASHLTTNVAGFILPGNKVDVLLNIRAGRAGGVGGGGTITLLQAIEVLAVDQLLEAPADNRYDPKGLNSVTLLVTPEQATLLDLGQNMGTLTFSLRNLADVNQTETTPTTVNDFRFLTNPTRSSGEGQPSLAPGKLSELQKMLQDDEPPLRRGTIVTLRGNQRGFVSLGEGDR